MTIDDGSRIDIIPQSSSAPTKLGDCIWFEPDLNGGGKFFSSNCTEDASSWDDKLVCERKVFGKFYFSQIPSE